MWGYAKEVWFIYKGFEIRSMEEDSTLVGGNININGNKSSQEIIEKRKFIF